MRYVFILAICILSVNLQAQVEWESGAVSINTDLPLEVTLHINQAFEAETEDRVICVRLFPVNVNGMDVADIKAFLLRVADSMYLGEGDSQEGNTISISDFKGYYLVFENIERPNYRNMIMALYIDISQSSNQLMIVEYKDGFKDKAKSILNGLSKF